MLDLQDPGVCLLLREDAAIRATQQHWTTPIPRGQDAPSLTREEIAGIRRRDEIRRRLGQLRQDPSSNRC